MKAIIYHESRGIPQKGLSGEMLSVGQWLEPTWRARSIAAVGYVAPMTRINEEYVLAYTVQSYLDKGYTPYQYAMIHNGGEVKAKKGINKFGQYFNTVAYAEAVTSKIR